MGSPGSGKTYQMVKCAEAICKEGKHKVYAVDLEDKLEGMLIGTGNLNLVNFKWWKAFSWEELKVIREELEKLVQPGDWLMIDRADLPWPAVQRWYTQQKYNEELADVMMKKAMAIKNSFMVAPRFDQGSWQVINEQYDSFMGFILYRSRANVLLTTGIKAASEDTPLDTYGSLGVLPRGQKELGHQPHSVFLLNQERQGKGTAWKITTAKDLPNRTYFDHEDLFDFSVQYLALYYGG